VERIGAADIVVLPNDNEPERHTWQRSIRQVARELGVREATLAEVYAMENILFLSLEYNNIIKPALFKTKRLINIHFSHLPKYKGMYTSCWPILNGESESGVTLHRIDKGIDTGDIIAQATFPIAPDHTCRDVYFNYLRTGYDIIVANFEKLLNDDFQSKPQSPIGSSYYSRKSIDYANLKVSFWATAQQVHNYVRAFSFYEYQLPRVFGAPIWKSEITPEPSVGKPGELAREDEHSFVVNTVDFNVRLFKDYSLRLFEAVAAGDETRVRELAALTHDVNLTNRQGWSALMVACYQHRASAVAALLAAGANVNQHNLNGTSVFMYAKDGAVNSGDTTLLDTLLQHGADINWRDFTGKTVLDYCRANGNQDVVAFLEARDAH
jgi:methionyl-tRNA formyltransferase